MTEKNIAGLTNLGVCVSKKLDWHEVGCVKRYGAVGDAVALCKCSERHADPRNLVALADVIDDALEPDGAKIRECELRDIRWALRAAAERLSVEPEIIPVDDLYACGLCGWSGRLPARHAPDCPNGKALKSTADEPTPP